MELSFDDSVLARDSDAFNPDTGERVGKNVLRRVADRVRLLRWRPTRVFHDWATDIARMTYAELLTRMAQFEAAHPEITKEVIGTSTGGKDIVAYRLGDGSKDAICFITSVHGNEVDGAEGMFSIMDDLAYGTYDELTPITDQHDIWWVVAANPDGWENDLRNLEGVGPNGLTVNLNRQFNFDWDDYIESGAESKGYAPAGVSGAEPEADALYDFVLDSGNRIIAVFDHHQNIGQGHRYCSRGRIDSFSGLDYTNFDFDFYRLQGSIRKQRGDTEVEFCQFRRSKGVPHFHTWVSSTGRFAMAMESRKDEPMGDYGAVIWTYDATLAGLVMFTDVFWDYKDVCLIEREATNLLVDIEWYNWTTGLTVPTNYVRNRATLTKASERFFTPMNSLTKGVDLLNELAVDPTEASAEWKALQLYSTATVAIGRVPSSGQLQGVAFMGENVATGALTPAASPSGATRGFGLTMVAPAVVRVYGGWSEDGLTLYSAGFSASCAADGLFAAAGGTALPLTLADMGYACDENNTSRISVFVGGQTGVVGSAFVATFTGKILKHNGNGAYTWTDTGLTVSARKNPCVVWQPGTDRFWIFGGEDSSGNYLDDIYVYDVSANTVTASGTTLPYPMTEIAGAADDDGNIYLYGGLYDDAGTVERSLLIQEFVPGSATLTTIDVLANPEDEASHDESYWSLPISGAAAARYSAGSGGTEILVIGGTKNLIASESDQLQFFAHDYASNTITIARDGAYAMLSEDANTSCSVGDWFALSTFPRSISEGDFCWHRAAITFRGGGSGTTWRRHARSYYRIAPVDRHFWERSVGRCKAASETNAKAYLRSYGTGQSIRYDRFMFCQRSRATSYHPTTRAAETLTFDESLRINNLAIRFLWNPTFSFVNVGEDLELARVSIDANNYISIVAIQGAEEKTYHSGNNLKAPQYPQIECRKYRASALESTLSLTLYYGYDARSSTVEAYDDPVEFVVEHVAGQRFAFGIWRYGILGWTEDRGNTDAFAGREAALIYNGEGYYGVPFVSHASGMEDAAREAGSRDIAGLGVTDADCIHPGEPDAE